MNSNQVMILTVLLFVKKMKLCSTIEIPTINCINLKLYQIHQNTLLFSVIKNLLNNVRFI